MTLYKIRYTPKSLHSTLPLYDLPWLLFKSTVFHLPNLYFFQTHLYL